MVRNPPPPEQYPEAYREMLMKFSESVKKLGEFFF
ncbi:hypothetical protein Patl1_23195 [Pistacia atlantica]|uniref:Uncharacterized protein n=1 Tax=Pistacia atlantica TaxID=434234 RepID=A0ACC0ZWW5_9ROSI|nr:hypothetical protein Patl1_23195 [Pistacia atlantica]